MTNSTLQGLVTVSVHNVIPSGAGFGVVIGSGANCMIPSRVLYAADLSIGDLVRCKLIDNPSVEYRHKTPFMVAYVDPNETAALRLAMNGGTAPKDVMQLDLPLEQPTSTALEAAFAAWDDEDEVAEPAPEPAHKPLTIFDVRDMVTYAMKPGGAWTVGDLREAIWPDDEFGSSDPRYKLLSNAVRDLHGAGTITAFGCRYSQDGILTGIHYTMFPEHVSITWTGPLV